MNNLFETYLNELGLPRVVESTVISLRNICLEDGEKQSQTVNVIDSRMRHMADYVISHSDKCNQDEIDAANKVKSSLVGTIDQNNMHDFGLDTLQACVNRNRNDYQEYIKTHVDNENTTKKKPEDVLSQLSDKNFIKQLTEFATKNAKETAIAIQEIVGKNKVTKMADIGLDTNNPISDDDIKVSLKKCIELNNNLNTDENKKKLIELLQKVKRYCNTMKYEKIANT